MRGKNLYWGAAILLVMFLSGSAFAANLQLMSEKMAKQDLRRNIMESVIGYKVKSEGQFGLTQDANYTIEQKAAAVMKGVVEERIVYDKNKDICICIGYLDLGNVQNILGERIRYKNVKVRGVGFGTMSPQYRGHLLALRAALVNAYDEMANLIVGQKISSYSKVENFVLTRDSNKSQVCAAIYGARIPNVDLDSRDRGWGWDDSGNAFVKLTMDLSQVKDVLGARIIYKGTNTIEVTGRGSQTDDLKNDAGEQAVDKGNAPAGPEPGRVELPGYEPVPPK
jgi:hypothetical protein